MTERRHPRLLVLSTLFPHAEQPEAGLFIRERMFRVGHYLPLVVVAPRSWFPGQGLLRVLRPHFRPLAPSREVQDGIEVYRPRFLAIPGFCRALDGWSMAIASLPTLRRLRDRFDIIDAHFAYPEGYAATLLGRWLGVPATITLRGTEVRISRSRLLRRLMLKALARAARVFAVVTSLKHHMGRLGADTRKIRVIGNGVDSDKFRPLPRDEARRRLGLVTEGPVLVSVGGLVERKGFHRVIELLPELKREFPDLNYLVVGAPGPEGDMSNQLQHQVRTLGLEDTVRFLGAMPSEELKWSLSAADVFVLASRNEGWANVFLEAMACGLPVVTTDVGGNREVVSDSQLGTIVPFGEPQALHEGLRDALTRSWDRATIRQHACRNHWDRRVEALVGEFETIFSNSEGIRNSSRPARENLGL